MYKNKYINAEKTQFFLINTSIYLYWWLDLNLLQNDKKIHIIYCYSAVIIIYKLFWIEESLFPIPLNFSHILHQTGRWSVFLW